MSPNKSPDKLVYMANQIGKFFASQGEAQATAGIANHLEKFWDPRMRLAIFAHLEAGGAGLEPLVRQAIEQLKEKGSSQQDPHKTAANGGQCS
jgi:formate dehydrogenase subunit delta